ncbi:hypothetical protein HYH02_000953 [Chlamydomonas schloesseri]|uniref:ShKT domain-containing protein n=1 Tax=Chlamydomonas schloesseri TaxID=2026947 RepID=A0A835WX90_9CHLO|nr:hypothetical protein HYH02_000953 [Chlamydomonas schloesseri]|eukprot:KAG2455134.1 hypothetical protein HYH02_000953 [Chlamydomonas schloesseri]
MPARYERINSKYLLDMLDADRLLWVFRTNAKLPAPGKPYIGSWEDPNCELRGHFVGHYLSALSLAWAGTGNKAFLERLQLMVAELGKVQEALGSGYLSAFPTSWFDRVESLQAVWAPYYTIHKILAGLVDAYELAGVEAALPMATRMVDYHWNRTQAIISKKGAKHWQKVLEFEYGGMNEILYRLYRITGNENHRDFASMFDKTVFLGHMAAHNDVLYDLHANTHLAQIVGFAAGYEATGNPRLRAAVNNFFEIVVQHHGYATGGTSVFERWEHTDHMAYVIAERFESDWAPRNALKTHETCTQYNMLKIARQLFLWTGDVYYADHYERAMVNGMWGVARLPADELPEAHAGDEHHHHHHHHRRNLDAMRQGLLSGHSHSHSHSHALPKKGGGAAVAAAAGDKGADRGGKPVSPYTRFHDDEWMDYISFSKPKPEWNASDAPGPGVYLYLLPMGHGNSKSDNLHHWGFPFHSFWCCYGTVIESYAKLADSIYFKDMSPESEDDADKAATTTTATTATAVKKRTRHDVDPSSSQEASSSSAAGSAVKLPPRLYVNQFVSSRLVWRELGLAVTMEADGFAPGPAITAKIRVAQLTAAELAAHAAATPSAAAASKPTKSTGSSSSAAAGGPASDGTFTLMLRIPAWARDGGVLLELNGQAFNGCPGAPLPDSYCRITRKWAARDVLSLRMGLRWWFSPAQDAREEYRSLKALMLGPYMMVGVSHDDYTVGLPAADAHARGLDSSRGGPDGHVYPPEEADELVSVQAGWNASLHLRHDAQILYMSVLEDGGDAMDATFRIGRGCHHGGSSSHGASAGSGKSAGAAGAGGRGGGASMHHAALSQLHGSHEAGGASHSHHGSLASAFSSLRSMMRLGAHDSGSALSLESMSYPNHYLAHDHTDVIVLQPGPPREDASHPFAPCSRAMWMMRPGLDGAADTVSFEAVGRPGWFVSAAAPPGEAAAADNPATCVDAKEVDCAAALPDGCGTNAFLARVLCRKTCRSCLGTQRALRLRQQVPGSAVFAATASFRLAPPARRAYPAGAHVLAGSNRHYLLAPLGNLVDERYSAYFNVLPDDAVPMPVRKSGTAAAAAAPKAAGDQGFGIRSTLVYPRIDEGVGKNGFEPRDEADWGEVEEEGGGAAGGEDEGGAGSSGGAAEGYDDPVDLGYEQDVLDTA